MTLELLLGEPGSGSAVEWVSGADNGDCCGSDVSVRVDSEVPSSCVACRFVSRARVTRVGVVLATVVAPTLGSM